MGVSCLKLEGRMKRPEYVAVVTAHLCPRCWRKAAVPPPTERAELEQAFSRVRLHRLVLAGQTRRCRCSAPVRRTLRTPRTSLRRPAGPMKRDSLRTVPVRSLLLRFRGGALHPDCVGPGRAAASRSPARCRRPPGPGPWIDWSWPSPPPQDRRHRLPLRHRGHPGR